MLDFKGEYNTAHVMTDHPDQTTISQIYSFINSPIFDGNENIAIMPDCHAGKGSCIGFTSTISQGTKIIPNIVGVDIGCGMLAFPTFFMQFDYQKFDEFVRENIPYGFNIHQSDKQNKEMINDFIQMGIMEKEDEDEYKEISRKVGQKPNMVIESLGTLGGGNHFIEVDRDQRGLLWIVIHTGSRHFGLSIAHYHQQKAKEYSSGVPKGLEYLEGSDRSEYFSDMELAQRYSQLNRYFIAQRLNRFFDCKITDFSRLYESIHNYIDMENNIIRKGAISANKDEDLIIPINSSDGTILGKGLGLESWNYSAPHGAGRRLSRRKAKEELGFENYKCQMKDVWSSCVSEKTLDEAPDAYKSKEETIQYISETIQIEEILKPVYNFKSD